MIIENVGVLVVVDVGIGVLSEVVEVFEMGVDVVLVNSVIVLVGDFVVMVEVMG